MDSLDQVFEFYKEEGLIPPRARVGNRLFNEPPRILVACYAELNRIFDLVEMAELLERGACYFGPPCDGGDVHLRNEHNGLEEQSGIYRVFEQGERLFVVNDEETRKSYVVTYVPTEKSGSDLLVERIQAFAQR